MGRWRGGSGWDLLRECERDSVDPADGGDTARRWDAAAARRARLHAELRSLPRPGPEGEPRGRAAVADRCGETKEPGADRLYHAAWSGADAGLRPTFGCRARGNHRLRARGESAPGGEPP